MIPYFQIHTLDIGPLTLQVWGTAVAIGILFAVVMSAWYGRRRYQLPSTEVYDAAFWALCAGIIGARLWYVVVEWKTLQPDSMIDIVAVWNGGLSFSGGLVCGALALVIYARVQHISVHQLIAVVAYGLPFGTAIGRIGCFLIYDHPGTPTQFFLGQEYLDGIMRHNHGLYLAGVASLVSVVFLVLSVLRRDSARMILIGYLLSYGVTRLILDFWRASDILGADTRYLGLTAAQYTAFFCVVIGGYVWYSVPHDEAKKKSTTIR